MPSLILTLTALLIQGPAPAAAPYISQEGGFRAAFPGPTMEKTSEVPSPRGPIPVHFVVAERDGVHHIVSYSDYPKALADRTPDAILEEAAVGPVRGVDGKLVGKSDRRIGRSPGKELEFTFDGPGNVPSLGRVRLYLAGSRIYSLTMIGPKARVVAAGDAFFASFAISRSISSTRADASEADPSTARAGFRAPVAPTFAPPGGGFVVGLPGTPEARVQVGAAASGRVETHVFSSRKADLTLIAAFADLPNVDSPDAVLDAALAEKVAASRGTLVGSRSIRLGDLPGREFESTLPAVAGSLGDLALSRIYLNGSRLYQLTVVGPAASVRSDAAVDFLDSFSLDPAPTR